MNETFKYLTLKGVIYEQKERASQTKNLFQYVNEFIESLNKVSLLIIFILYASILGIILNAIPNIKTRNILKLYI